MSLTKIDASQISGNIGGGVNYIANGTAETDLTGWATFADAAQSTPTDGTGGSPTVTWTRSTSSPLIGAASFVFTKDAANRQGQGASYDFTIDSAFKNSVLQIQFNYAPDSTYVNQELTVYIYDVTNAQIIQPGGYIVNDIHTPGRFVATFQTTSSTSYRLIFFIAGTTATAYTIQIDGVSVGPQVIEYGAPITDWQAYTPTWQFAPVSLSTGFWRRVGDSMEVVVRAILSGAATGTISVNIPTGYAIDQSKITSPNVLENVGFVKAIRTNAPVAPTGLAVVKAVGSGPITEVQFYGASTGAWDGSGQPGTWVSTDQINAKLFVPIVGWSSTVQMSNDTDTRVVAVSYTATGATSTPNTTLTIPSTSTAVTYDTHGSLNLSTAIYTVPVSGYYRVSALIGFSSNGTGVRQLSVRLNSTNYVLAEIPTYATTAYITGAGTFKCNAGDTLAFVSWQNSTTTLNSFLQYGYIERLSGPASIAATETVAARYYTNTATSFGTGGVIPFELKSYDTHGAVSGSGSSWVFTAPIAGKYKVTAHIDILQSMTTAQAIDLFVRVNGSIYSHFGRMWGVGTSQQYQAWGSDCALLKAGDTISIYASCIAGTAIYPDTQWNYVDIERIGN
jgi:hypothetical protein